MIKKGVARFDAMAGGGKRAGFEDIRQVRQRQGRPVMADGIGNGETESSLVPIDQVVNGESGNAIPAPSAPCGRTTTRPAGSISK